MTLPIARELAQFRHSRAHHRGRACSDPAIGQFCRRRRRTAWPASIRSAAGSGMPTSSPRLALHMIDNHLPERKVVRLDASLRMAPR